MNKLYLSISKLIGYLQGVNHGLLAEHQDPLLNMIIEEVDKELKLCFEKDIKVSKEYTRKDSSLSKKIQEFLKDHSERIVLAEEIVPLFPSERRKTIYQTLSWLKKKKFIFSPGHGQYKYIGDLGVGEEEVE